MFNLQVQIEKIDKREPTMEWVLDRISHRSYLFNLIKNMIKEYDLRFNNGRFLTERSIIAEIGCWGSMENIDWSFTGLK